jgi:uncharacterized membrane protein YkoI
MNAGGISLLAVSILILLPLGAKGGEPVAMSDVPEAARRSIELETTGAVVQGIARTVENGGTFYDVTASKNGRTVCFSVAPDGTLHELVALNETPDVVQKAIRREIGDGRVDSIDKTLDYGEFFYDVDATRGGREWSFSVASDGTLSQQVELAETPDAVRAFILKETTGGKIDALSKTTEAGGIFYDVDYTRNGRRTGFSVSSDGVLCEPAGDQEAGGNASSKLNFLLAAGIAIFLVRAAFLQFKKRKAGGGAPGDPPPE